jgi:hypothetical protein
MDEPQGSQESISSSRDEPVSGSHHSRVKKRVREWRSDEEERSGSHFREGSVLVTLEEGTPVAD